MVTTRRRTMTDTTFDHVVITLMNINVKQHTYKVLRGNNITSAYEIIGLTDDMLANLVYDDIDDTGTIVYHDKPIPYYNQSLLRILGDFFWQKKKDKGSALEESDILATTKSEWSQY
jgi:hypothetical protein